MANPKKGEPGYEEYRARFNEYRRNKRKDPERWAREKEGMYRRRRERAARKREEKRQEEE